MLPIVTNTFVILSTLAANQVAACSRNAIVQRCPLPTTFGGTMVFVTPVPTRYIFAMAHWTFINLFVKRIHLTLTYDDAQKGRTNFTQNKVL